MSLLGAPSSMSIPPPSPNGLAPMLTSPVQSTKRLDPAAVATAAAGGAGAAGSADKSSSDTGSAPGTPSSPLRTPPDAAAASGGTWADKVRAGAREPIALLPLFRSLKRFRIAILMTQRLRRRESYTTFAAWRTRADGKRGKRLNASSSSTIVSAQAASSPSAVCSLVRFARRAGCLVYDGFAGTAREATNEELATTHSQAHIDLVGHVGLSCPCSQSLAGSSRGRSRAPRSCRSRAISRTSSSTSSATRTSTASRPTLRASPLVA